MEVAVTGAQGFIGKAVSSYLKSYGFVIHEFDKSNCKDFPGWLEKVEDLYAVVHLGAITDTTCQDEVALAEYNTEYSKELWTICAKRRMKLIYASSAATYGDGSQGFDDTTEKLFSLKPLNLYAESKHKFDVWAIENAMTCTAPPTFAGLKFFNVYGEDEFSKGKMASMVFQACQQAIHNGKIGLFRAGEQKRDWVYVGDICEVIRHMLSYRCYAIYNVGSGEARSFNEVARAVANFNPTRVDIEYIDMPASLKNAYQSYSKADLSKLRRTGFDKKMTTLEEGVAFLMDELLGR